jgi:predicted MPP superfamily phosphohydrolase
MILALRLLFFVSTMIAVTAGLHRYLWVRLARDPALPALAQRGVALALVALVGATIATMLLVRAAPREVVRPFAWVAYTWMGVLFFLVASLFVADVARWLAPSPVDEARRTLFARAAAALAGVVALGAASKAAANVRGPVAIARVPVTLPRLRGERAWRMAQISDVHIGPTLGREWLAGVVDRMNAERPDIVVITGDLVDGSVEALAEHVAPLARLVAPHGVFFVTGNHEYYSGASAWCAHLGSLGIRVLRNECVTVGGEEEGFTLAGVDDWTAHQFARLAPGHRHDLEAALRGAPEGRAIVLLAHQPKSVREAAPRGVDLQLSGHTHGGQLFPFNFLVRFQQPHVAGLERVSDRTQIYVSRGTGYWGPPMRLGAPAEITLLTLQRG